MEGIIRESSFGSILRWVSKNKILKYYEEEDSFTFPKLAPEREKPALPTPPIPAVTPDSQDTESNAIRNIITDPTPVEPADDDALVGWYTSNDTANPQNWPGWKKGFTTIQIL